MKWCKLVDINMSYYGLLWASGIINKNIVTHRNLYELIKFYSGDERDEETKETTTKLSIINSPCCLCCPCCL